MSNIFPCPAYRGLHNVCNRNVKSEKATTFLIWSDRGRRTMGSSTISHHSSCFTVANMLQSSVAPCLYVRSLHVISLHASNDISLHVISLHVISLHVISLHVISLHVISLHVISLHVISLHVCSLHVCSLHVRSLHVRSLHASNDISLHGSS